MIEERANPEVEPLPPWWTEHYVCCCCKRVLQVGDGLAWFDNTISEDMDGPYGLCESCCRAEGLLW